MRRLLLLSAGLVALAATIAAVPFQSNKECPGDELYTQYPDADDCKSFFICLYGKKVQAKCPSTMLYNSAKMKCDKADRVTCSTTGKPVEPEEPQVPEEPEIPEEPELPEETEITEEPQIPEDPEVPEEPEMTEEPQIPEEPEVPEEPEMTEEPEIPEEPEVPEEPEEELEEPEEPEVPEEKPTEPEEPEEPEEPQDPETPEMPEPEELDNEPDDDQVEDEDESIGGSRRHPRQLIPIVPPSGPWTEFPIVSKASYSMSLTAIFMVVNGVLLTMF